MSGVQNCYDVVRSFVVKRDPVVAGSARCWDELFDGQVIGQHDHFRPWFHGIARGPLFERQNPENDLPFGRRECAMLVGQLHQIGKFLIRNSGRQRDAVTDQGPEIL